MKRTLVSLLAVVLALEHAICQVDANVCIVVSESVSLLRAHLQLHFFIPMNRNALGAAAAAAALGLAVVVDMAKLRCRGVERTSTPSGSLVKRIVLATCIVDRRVSRNLNVLLLVVVGERREKQ